MFTEVLIATISVKAGTNLDHEFKEKKNKFSSAPKGIFKQEEYTMPIEVWYLIAVFAVAASKVDTPAISVRKYIQ